MGCLPSLTDSKPRWSGDFYKTLFLKYQIAFLIFKSHHIHGAYYQWKTVELSLTSQIHNLKLFTAFYKYRLHFLIFFFIAIMLYNFMGQHPNLNAYSKIFKCLAINFVIWKRNVHASKFSPFLLGAVYKRRPKKWNSPQFQNELLLCLQNLTRFLMCSTLQTHQTEQLDRLLWTRFV